MIAERNTQTTRRTSVSAVLAAAVVAAVACGGPTPTSYQNTDDNTAPGTTVARVVVETPFRTTLRVQDSLIFVGHAYDSGNTELPVGIEWHTANPSTFEINPGNGHGQAKGEGQSSVWATVGVVQSNIVPLTVTR